MSKHIYFRTFEVQYLNDMFQVLLVRNNEKQIQHTLSTVVYFVPDRLHSEQSSFNSIEERDSAFFGFSEQDAYLFIKNLFDN